MGLLIVFAEEKGARTYLVVLLGMAISLENNWEPEGLHC